MHNRRYGNAETSIKSIKKISRHSDSLQEICFNSNRKTRAVRRDKRVDNLKYIYHTFFGRFTINTIKTFLYWHMKHDGSCVSLFLEYLCQTYVSRVTVEQNKSELFWLEGPWFPDIDLPVPFYTT